MGVKKSTENVRIFIPERTINGVKVVENYFSFHSQYGRRHIVQFNYVCNLRPCNHGDGPV